MIAEEIRSLLVEVTGREELRDIPAELPLLHEPVALDSLSGVRLLRAVHDRYGVDIAAEDLNLDALASVDALVAFIAERTDTVDGEYATMRKLEAYTPKKLYLVDATYGDSPALGDVTELESIARAAVEAAGGHVLKDSHVVFPNGAITLVLILAESHLSLHTWPEENLVAIDLFSCGAIEGRIVIDRLVTAFRLGEAPVREIDRGLGPVWEFHSCCAPTRRRLAALSALLHPTPGCRSTSALPSTRLEAARDGSEFPNRP